MKYWLLMVEHDDYSYALFVLEICKAYDLVAWGIFYINKVLGKIHEYNIMDFIMHFVDTLNADMVNIIVNMNIHQHSSTISNDFKKLLEI